MQFSREEICALDDEPPVQGAGFSWLLHARQLPYADVLLLMMTVSDNLCTNLILRRAGMERLNEVFQRDLGLTETRLERKMMDLDARARGRDNYIGAEDCIRLYTLIEQLTTQEREVGGCPAAGQSGQLAAAARPAARYSRFLS